MPRQVNLIGTTLGRLHIEGFVGRIQNGNHGTTSLWKCKCDCGKTVEKPLTYLKGTGIKVPNCGCVQQSKYQPGFKIGVLSIVKRVKGDNYLLKCEVCNKESKLCKTKFLSLPPECCCDKLRQHSDKTCELLLNKKIGKFFVKQLHGKNANGGRLWECICDCGKVCYVDSSRLLNIAHPSCGCYKKDLYEDIAGKTFNVNGFKFKVLKRLGSHPNGGCLWHCRSECGHEFKEITSRIKSGSRKACGMCIRRPWLPSEEKLVRNLAGKETLIYIANKLNRTTNSIRQFCQTHGISNNLRKTRLLERRAEINSLVIQGLGDADIANILKVSKSLVSYYKRQTKRLVEKELQRTRQILSKTG